MTIETADPVDTITLSGSGFLFGVREPHVAGRRRTRRDRRPAPSSSTESCSRTRRSPTHRRPSTRFNLQQPSLPTDPSSGPPPPPASLGFRLEWLPPPPAGTSGPVAWPPDLGAYPPFDALGFRLERRHVDSGGPFEQLDGAEQPTLVLGSRGGHRDPPPLGLGVDLEAVFPDAPEPTPARLALDVARRRARQRRPRGPAARQHPPVPGLLRRCARPRVGERVRGLDRPAREAAAAAAAGGLARPSARGRDRAERSARAGRPGRRPESRRRRPDAARRRARTPSCWSGAGRRPSGTPIRTRPNSASTGSPWRRTSSEAR